MFCYVELCKTIFFHFQVHLFSPHLLGETLTLKQNKDKLHLTDKLCFTSTVSDNSQLLMCDSDSIKMRKPGSDALFGNFRRRFWSLLWAF